MNCIENIRSIFALRGGLALFSNKLNEKMLCELVTEHELEEKKFLFNVLELIGMRMCQTASMPEVSVTIGGSYLAPETNGIIRLKVFSVAGDELGEMQFGPSILGAPSPAEIVIQGLDSLASTGNLYEDVYEYFAKDTHTIVIRFYPNRGGYVERANITPDSANSFITLRGNLEAVAEREAGCLASASGDQDKIKNIANWFSHRISSVCDDKVYITNMGDCPPGTHVPCDLISSNSFSFVYYEDFVLGGIEGQTLSPGAELNAVTFTVDSPVAYTRLGANTRISLTESTTGDIYYFEHRTALLDPAWAGAATEYWVVVSVLPFGSQSEVDADKIILDALATYTWAGNIPITTNKGNKCEVALRNKIDGRKLVEYSPPPMSLTNLVIQADQIYGSFTENISLKPPAIVELYKDSVPIYQWAIGSSSLVNIGGNQFQFLIPSSLELTDPGTYSISWPQGWACSPDGALAPALSVNTYTFVIAASPPGFTYTFPITLS